MSFPIAKLNDTTGVYVKPPSRDLRHRVMNSREKSFKVSIFFILFCMAEWKANVTLCWSVLRIVPYLQVSLFSDSQPPNRLSVKCKETLLFSITFSHIYTQTVYINRSLQLPSQYFHAHRKNHFLGFFLMNPLHLQELVSCSMAGKLQLCF